MSSSRGSGGGGGGGGGGSAAGGSSSPWGKPAAASAANQRNQSSPGAESAGSGLGGVRERKKSLTLQAMGAKMIAEGRSPADLTLDDLKQLDPMTLPPKLRTKVQPQHPLYERESASYGKQAPNEFQKPPTQHATSQSFTKWHGGKFAPNTALNTGVDKSRVHSQFDQF